MRYIILVLLASLSAQTWAVDCSSSSITLTTQAEVDSLQADYGPCDRVSGALSVRGADITDIDGLSGITSVGDVSVGIGLSISVNPALNNVDGLSNLTSVGYLGIGGNQSLTNLDGLSNLTHVGLLLIGGNQSLTNLDGLSGLSSVEDYVSIRENDSLANIDGLAGVAYVAAGMIIESNPNLTNLNGFSSLTSVGMHQHISTNGNHFIIRSNASLSDIDGLSNLTRVGWQIDISDNPLLASISALSLTDTQSVIIRNNVSLADVSMPALIGVQARVHVTDNASLAYLNLSNLTNVSGLEITDNASLANLDGLSGLVSVGSWFWLQYNNSLTNVDGLAALTNVGDDLIISSNNALISLDGLAALTNVGDDLIISSNISLISLDGLSGITEINRELIVAGNRALTNLDGLLNISSVGDNLKIYSNSIMADCSGAAVLLGWPNGPPDDGVIGDTTIQNNASGCNSVEEILASVTGPTQPEITAVTPGNGSLQLAFNEATTPDRLYPVLGYEVTCFQTMSGTGPAGPDAIVDDRVLESQIFVTGVESANTSASVEVDIDITHERMRHLVITLTSPQGTELTLWNLGSVPSADLSGTFPTTLSPIDDLSAWEQEDIIGQWLLKITDTITGYEGTLNSWNLRIVERSTTSGSSSPIAVFGLVNGSEYSCTVAPITALGALPASTPVLGTPAASIPSQPTITAIEQGDEEITVRFSVNNDGGSPITSYTVSCNGIEAIGTSSPITVTGLTNHTVYSCTVTATNAVGTSPVSVAQTATPEEMIHRLNIILIKAAVDAQNP